MSEEGPKWLTELFNAISYDCKDAQWMEIQYYYPYIKAKEIFKIGLMIGV